MNPMLPNLARRMPSCIMALVSAGLFYPTSVAVAADDQLLLHIAKGHEISITVQAHHTISGYIRNTDENPLSDGHVSVEFGGRKYNGTSGKTGKYYINIPKKLNIPNPLFVTADKRGYTVATRAINKTQFGHVDFILSKASQFNIEIDRRLHHLGNGAFSGSVNSQFQRADAEGAAYSVEFLLDDAQLPPNVITARLMMNAKGVQGKTPVSINGKQVGVLDNSNQDGSVDKVEIPMDMCAFTHGNNTLAIHAGTSSGGEIDDFEFTNIELILTPAADIDSVAKDVLVEKLASINFIEAAGKTLTEIREGQSFYLTAKGKSRCKGLKDIARIKVTTQGTQEGEGKTVLLVETGPETGVFRSRQAIAAKDIHARAGQAIIAKAGFRGARIQVVSAGIGATRVASTHKPEQTERSYFQKEVDKIHELVRNNLLQNPDKLSADEQADKIIELLKHDPLLNSGKIGAETSKKDKHIEDILKSFKQQKSNEKKRAGAKPLNAPRPLQANNAAAEPLKGQPITGKNVPRSLPTNDAANVSSAPTQPAAPLKVGSTRWTTYKLKIGPRRAGDLPNIEVIKVAFKKGAARVALIVKSYPVSLVQNDAGKIFWSVNWRNSEILDTRIATQPDEILKLKQAAQQRKAGSVAKNELDTLIGNMLGPDARKK